MTRMRGPHSGAGTAIKRISVCSVVLTVGCAVVYHFWRIDAAYPLAVTFGTIAYHLLMRLAVGSVFSKAMNNRAELSKKWFQCGKREQALYRRLEIKRWKNRLPTYDSAQFDPAAHSWDEIAQAMCQAELVHEVIVVLSFVPVFFSGRFGALPVFVITSVLAAAFDLLFVMIQRYNRSRVVRLIRRKNSVREKAPF